MKKLFFLISLIAVFTAFESFARSINISAPHGEILYIDDSTTVAQLFRECRNQGFCDSNRRLVLYFDRYEIVENSEAANKSLWFFGNHVEYAMISYYIQPNNNYVHDCQYRPISIRASNGMVTTLQANSTPAYFFRACRSAGNCSSTAPMTLKFGNYEIKEDSSAANKCFYEFDTNANYAYVMYWDNYNVNYYNYSDSELQQATAALGTTIFGIGFLYFLSQLNR